MRLENFPNPDVIEVHLHTRLTEDSVFFDSKGWRLNCTADDTFLLNALRTLSGQQRPWQAEMDERRRLSPLVDSLFVIEGMVSVAVHQYSLSLCKGTDFSWDEILPEVEQILKNNNLLT